MSMTTLVNFFISLCLWLFSGGIYQTLVAFIFLALFLKLILKETWIHAFTFTLGAQFFSLIALIGLYSIIHFGLGYTYVPVSEVSEKSYSVLYASINLGLVYTILQAFFFRMLRKYQHVRLHHILSFVFISNMAAAFFTYWFSPPLF